MTSNQNDTGMTKYSLDSDKKKEPTSKMTSDPAIKSSLDEATVSGVLEKTASEEIKKYPNQEAEPDIESSLNEGTTSSVPEETASKNESEEIKEPPNQEEEPSMRKVPADHELSNVKEISDEAKRTTLNPEAATTTPVVSPPVLSEEPVISEETVDKDSKVNNTANLESEIDATKAATPTTEEADKDILQELKKQSAPEENQTLNHEPSKAAPITENQEKQNTTMDVDQISQPETESQSSTELGPTTLSTKVNLKSMILDCYSMLTKDEEARLAKKLPSVDCHKGSIRPGFFDDNNTIFWDTVNHWRIDNLGMSETDVSTHSSRYDTIKRIMNKYSTGRPEEIKGKRKMSISVPEKKVARIRVNPPKPQGDTNHTEKAALAKRTGLHSQSKNKRATK